MLPLKLKPMLVAVLELNPLEGEGEPSTTQPAALLKSPVVANWCVPRQMPCITAEVPLPTVRHVAITSNMPMSATLVPAPKV